MGDGTRIEWTDATWNPITGCSVVSPGCTNCYAMRLAGTRLRHHPTRAGLTTDSKAGPVWNGKVRFNEPALLQPLQWKRPRMIFVCAHGDLFHEAVPDEWIDQVFAVMALCPQHTFQVLTKRAERMRGYMHSLSGRSWVVIAGRARWSAMPTILPNVWLGVSAEDQARAQERIPDLVGTPAAKRFVSCEPLLGPIDMETIDIGDSWGPGATLDWVIVGGESGKGARPMHSDWARSLRDQCAAAGVPFFFKQWGEWLPFEGHPIESVPRASFQATTCKETGQQWWLAGKRAAGRLLDGIEHNAMPAARHDP